MKKYFYFAISATLILVSCDSTKDYTSNDPDADLNASACYDIDDTKQTSRLFFRPNNAWVGDPMPFYENGQFYVFYLHDSRPAKETFHPWYLATTTDLFSYQDKGEAIKCGEDNSQEDALGTGSVIKNGNTYYAFYTAHNRNLSPNEKIYLATSTDLINWEKQPSFSLQAQNNYDANEFRDPFVYKDGNIFRMLITTRGYISAVNDWQAVIAQYTSTDLINWNLEEPFYYNGERFMECPQVFVMGEYQYLIYSNWDWANTNRRVLYRYRRVGASSWTIPNNDALDGALFYAGRSVFDGTNHYLMGWIPTREQYKDKGNFSWGGSLAVHQLSQNADGTLSLMAPKNITDRLSNVQNLGSVTLNASENKVFDRLEKTPTKITTNITAGTASQFGIRMGACGNLLETYDILFDLQQSKILFNKNEKGKSAVTITSAELPSPVDRNLAVTLIVEGSTATVYVNNKTALSLRSYRMNQNAWGVFSVDGTTSFSDINLGK